MTGLTASIRPFRLPLRQVLTTGRGHTRHRNGLLLGLSDGKHTGWGEATPMLGWSQTSADSAAASLAAVVTAISMIDSPSDERLDHLLDDLDRAPHSRAALAGALADLRAKRAGLTLALALTPAATAAVPVNALISAAAPAEVESLCAAAAQLGHRSIKIKVGVADTATDIERVAAARSAVGSEIELRIDANGAWPIDTAIDVLEQMANLGVSYCEEPADGIDSISAVGARSDIPVAVDESAHNVDDIARALGTGTIDVVIVKPQAMGGPDLAMRAIGLVREFGATAVVTSMVDGAIGVAHALHVAAASGVGLAHGLATSSLLEADIGPVPQVEMGMMATGRAPGIGIEPFDELPN